MMDHSTNTKRAKSILTKCGLILVFLMPLSNQAQSQENGFGVYHGSHPRGRRLTRKNMDSMLDKHPAKRKTLDTFRKLKQRSSIDGQYRATPASFNAIEPQEPAGFVPPANSHSSKRTEDSDSPGNPSHNEGSVKDQESTNGSPLQTPFNQLPLIDIEAAQKNTKTISIDQSPLALPRLDTQFQTSRPVLQSPTNQQSVNNGSIPTLIESPDDDAPRIEPPRAIQIDASKFSSTRSDFRSTPEPGKVDVTTENRSNSVSGLSPSRCVATDLDERWNATKRNPAPRRVYGSPGSNASRQQDENPPRNRLTAQTPTVEQEEPNLQYSKLFQVQPENQLSDAGQVQALAKHSGYRRQADSSNTESTVESHLSAKEIEDILSENRSSRSKKSLRGAMKENPFHQSGVPSGQASSLPGQSRPNVPVNHIESADDSRVNVLRRLRSSRGQVAPSNLAGQSNQQVVTSTPSESIAKVETKKYFLRDHSINQTEPEKQGRSVGGTIKRVAVTTCLVLVLCVGAILVLKKMGFRGPVSGDKNENRSMAVIDKTNISNRCQLQLVQIRNQKVLIGVDQNGIKSMTYLPNSFVEELDSAAVPTRKI